MEESCEFLLRLLEPEAPTRISFGSVAVVVKANGIPFWGIGAPPILEPILAGIESDVH